MLSAAAALLALFLCVGLLGPLADFFRDAIALSDLSRLHRAAAQMHDHQHPDRGVGEGLCKDAGQAAGAGAVQLVGVAAALYAALPLLRTFLTMIGACL